MVETTARTITISSENAEAIDRLVAEGRFGSADDVVRMGIEATREHDEWLAEHGPSDEWLRREVLPVLDEIDRDPSRLLTSEQVRANLAAHHERRVAERANVASVDADQPPDSRRTG